MKDFFPIKLTALAYVLLGIWLMIVTYQGTYNEYFQQRYIELIDYIRIISFGALPVLVGLGILKRQKSLAILSLVLLPIFWVVFVLGFAFIEGFAGYRSPYFWHSVIIPPVLFVLTVWSLIAMRKDKKKKEV